MNFTMVSLTQLSYSFTLILKVAFLDFLHLFKDMARLSLFVLVFDASPVDFINKRLFDICRIKRILAQLRFVLNQRLYDNALFNDFDFFLDFLCGKLILSVILLFFFYLLSLLSWTFMRGFDFILEGFAINAALLIGLI